MTLLNSTYVEIIAGIVLELRHKHALQKAVNNTGLVSEKCFLPSFFI